MNPSLKTVGIHIVTIGAACAIVLSLSDSILALVGCFTMGGWAVDLARWIDRA